MYELDKQKFGAFLAERRKALGLTQRQLAERLFVSNKAVSKWERGISIPDVSLLIPLAEALGVTVTELLEGQRLEAPAQERDQVERLVKTALTLSEEDPARLRERRLRRGLVWGLSAVAALVECLALSLFGWTVEDFNESGLLVLELLAVIFGCYFWLATKERLPAYYDENPISFYSDGVLRMNLPGVHFNNSNWPHIVTAVRLWSVLSAVLLPIALLLLRGLFPGVLWKKVALISVLLFTLGGLLLPVYIVGKRYE